jgi:hypothetical protein
MWLNLRHEVKRVNSHRIDVDWWCKACDEHLGTAHVIGFTTTEQWCEENIQDLTSGLLDESPKVQDDSEGVPYCLMCWNVQDMTAKWPKALDLSKSTC